MQENRTQGLESENSKDLILSLTSLEQLSYPSLSFLTCNEIPVAGISCREDTAT